MTDKKIDEAEAEAEVVEVEETTTDEVVTDEPVAAAKKAVKLPFAAVMVLGFGITLAVIIGVFGDKSANMSKTLKQVASTFSSAPADESAAADTSLSEPAVVDVQLDEVVEAEPQADANAQVQNTKVPVVPSQPVQGAQFASRAPVTMGNVDYDRFQQIMQQRQQAIEAQMQRQRQMMADMFEMRKTVFLQAEKRRQQSIEKMQEMQAKMEKRQLELLKKQQEAFKQAMQRS